MRVLRDAAIRHEVCDGHVEHDARPSGRHTRHLIERVDARVGLVQQLVQIVGA
ncbi:MAG: hypothetical protein Q8K79_17375 [Solirubrobacteraceae bacterium]|nr:hypothetical protein [Solirubrobacteraceae bacterium]